MISKTRLQQLAAQHGTPLLVIDHDELRKNFQTFRKYLPRVQPYFAVKAGADPAVVRTLFKEGASFDVASMPEFEMVYENVKRMAPKKRQQWIWDKIIYANPIKANETLQVLEEKSVLVQPERLSDADPDALAVCDDSLGIDGEPGSNPADVVHHPFGFARDPARIGTGRRSDHDEVESLADRFPDLDHVVGVAAVAAGCVQPDDQAVRPRGIIIFGDISPILVLVRGQ